MGLFPNHNKKGDYGWGYLWPRLKNGSSTMRDDHLLLGRNYKGDYGWGYFCRN